MMLRDDRGTRVREMGSTPKPTIQTPTGRAEHRFWQPKKAWLLR